MTLIAERTHAMGVGEQRIHRFPNGYGASVVRTPYTYGGDQGLWELAVIEFTGEGVDDFHLTYDTPVTNDVEGYLRPAGVKRLLAQIEALPRKEGFG